MTKIRRLLHISRPVFWPLMMAIYAAGVLYSSASWESQTWLGLIYFSFPVCLIILGLNDIADRESDAQNARKGGVEGAVLKKSEVRYVIKWVVSLALLFPLIFIVWGYYQMALSIIGTIVFAYAYSIKPIRFKSRPGFDSLSNGACALFSFLAGYSASFRGSVFQLPPSYYLLLFFLAPSAFHAFSTLVDYDTDKKVGDKTFAVYMGKRLTIFICTVAFAICCIASVGHNPVTTVYFLTATLLVGSNLMWPSYRNIHHAAWGILLAFPLAIIYFLAFGL
ncbi:MAG TPA: UbiA family prenyltransferase [Candidatus Saccharimonadales bacterium]|nr:UbiA family prenyltransferase [Candidatus Saccharimonadales bacterium]